jgi:hypothetical protein
MPNVAQILAAVEQGDPHAAAELLPLVYDELRKLAALHLANEKLGQTLLPTALLHEVYLRLVGSTEARSIRLCGHFSAAACAGLAAWRAAALSLVRRRVPDRHDVVRAGGGEAPAVGAECHPDAPLAPQGQEFLAGERVPYLDLTAFPRPIAEWEATARDQARAIGAEGH